MDSCGVNPDDPDKIHKWIEIKPLIEAVNWTLQEKFYLVAAVTSYKSDWKSITQCVKNIGAPYRPNGWYTQESCKHQLKMIITRESKQVQSMPVAKMLNYIYQNFLINYKQDLRRTIATNIEKCISLQYNISQMKQRNLSQSEINSIYLQTTKNEIENKNYVEQLRSLQIAILAARSPSSVLSEEKTKDVKTKKRNLEEIEQPKRAKKLAKDQEIDKFKPRMKGLKKKNDKPVKMQLKKTKIKKTNNSKLEKVKKKEIKDELLIKAGECEITRVEEEILRKKIRLQKVIETKIKHAFEIEIETKLTKAVARKLKRAKRLLKKLVEEVSLMTNMNESKSITSEHTEQKQNVVKKKKKNMKGNSKETKPNLQKKKEIVFSKNQSKKSITKSKQSINVTGKHSFKQTRTQKLGIKQNEKVPIIIKTERLKVEKMNNVPKNGSCRKYNTSSPLSFKQNKFVEKKSLSYKSNKQNKSDQYTDISVKQSKFGIDNNEPILPKGNYVNEKSDKLAPKKQGTKRRIDVTKLPQFTSTNNEGSPLKRNKARNV